MRKRQISPIASQFGMQVYDKNMRNITTLFYQKSKASSHKVAKEKIPYIPYIYSRIHTVQAACTSSTFERTFIKMFKKG
jgi:hypothetical protein